MSRPRELPFSCEQLPEPLHTAVLDIEARNADWDYGDVINAIDAFLEQGGQRSPDLLVALAWYRFEFAECVMVDDIHDASRSVLLLLGEARIDNRQVTKLRQNAQKAIRRVERQIARVEKLLAIPQEKLTLQQMKDLANFLSEQPEADHKARAAQLWLVLYEQQPESDIYHGTKFYTFARSAICLAQSGQYEKAEPLLRRTVAWPDRVAAANYNNFVCYAYEQMLLRARDKHDVETFRRIWTEAVDQLKTLGCCFPTVYPLQTAMLGIVFDMGIRDVMEYLVRLITENRKPATLEASTRRMLIRVQNEKAT